MTAATKTPARKWTEGDVLKLLRKKHAAQSGNGPEWAYLEHVRNAAGFDAKRTCDAMALSMWPSRGMELHGYEVKVTRSDWRTELRNPAKADVWHGVVDRWWIAAPAKVVPRDELPATWGLIEASDDGRLRVTVQAPLLTTERAAISRGLLVPMLRAAGVALKATPDQEAIDAARQEGWYQGAAAAERSSGMWKENCTNLQASNSQLLADLREVEQALGVPTQSWAGNDRAKEVAAALRVVLAQDTAEERARREIETGIRQMERAIGWMRQALDRNPKETT
jgi:hypothetical protein